MNTNRFTIQKYSGMAGVFLLIPAINDAQAIYTDLEPDIEIQFDEETAGIDMDNNGTNDFAFLKTSGGYYFYWTFTSTQVYRFRHRIWAGPQIPSNSIAGDYDYDSYAGPITYFPYALLSGTPINDELSWQNWGFQIMENGAYQNSEFGFRSGNWIPDKDSAYLGVRFIDDEECLHYGWIRCTTADSSKRLIIHDYAYESKCETPIVAGDTIGDTTNVNIDESNNLIANVYSFNRIIYVNTNLNFFVNLEILNLNGESLIVQRLTQNNTEINMIHFPSGIYFVKIYEGDMQYIKKLFIY